MADNKALIRLRELEAGSLARRQNKSISSCPWKDGSLEKTWWIKGFERPHLPMTPVVNAQYTYKQ